MPTLQQLLGPSQPQSNQGAPPSFEDWARQQGMSYISGSDDGGERFSPGAQAKYNAAKYGLEAGPSVVSSPTQNIGAYEDLLDAMAKGVPGSQLPIMDLSPERREQLIRGAASASGNSGDFRGNFDAQLTPQESAAVEQYRAYKAPGDIWDTVLPLAFTAGFGGLVAPSLLAAAGGAGSGSGAAAAGIGGAETAGAAGATGAGVAGSGGLTLGGAAPWWAELGGIGMGDPLAAAGIGGGAGAVGGAGGVGAALTGAGSGTGGGMAGLGDYFGPNGFYGDLLKGGLNLVSGAMGSGAAEDAANAQIGASQAAIAEQRRQYDLARADNTPFMQTGVQANRRLGALLGVDPTQSGAAGYGDLTRKFTMADRDADPVYQSGLQFGLDEGTKGINARAIAGGGYDSGATLKALTRFGNDYGSTKAEGAYNRFNTDNTNIYNRLAGVSGAGQTATNTVTSAGANTANNVSNLETGAGNARAAGIVGGQNAWGGALSGISQGIDNAENRKLLERILGGRGY